MKNNSPVFYIYFLFIDFKEHPDKLSFPLPDPRTDSDTHKFTIPFPRRGSCLDVLDSETHFSRADVQMLEHRLLWAWQPGTGGAVRQGFWNTVGHHQQP